MNEKFTRPPPQVTPPQATPEGRDAPEGRDGRGADPSTAPSRAIGRPRHAGDEPDRDRSLDDLERNLRATREDLESTTEELELSVEELRSANEESASADEELRFYNDELEFSRLELHTLNGELSAVNLRLETKLDELESASNDLGNLLASTEIATLFLDSELRIRTFTPAAAPLFNLIDGDVGRPIGDLDPRVSDPHLIEDSLRVLDQSARIQRHVQTPEDRWFTRRALPYRTAGNQVSGVVLTFNEVTALRRTAQRLEMREKQQALIAELGRLALTSTDLTGLFDLATRMLADTLECDFAKVLELLPDRRKLLLRSGVGWKEGLVGRATVDAGSSSQAGYTLETRSPVVVDDLARERRFRGPALLTEHGVVSGASIALGPPQFPWGVLGVHARRPMSFGVDDVNFLQSIGNVLSEAIANDRYESDLLENRAKLEAHYAELETVYRQTPVGLAVLDQDLRFLRVNEVLANFHGVPIEDSIGKRISEVLPEGLCSQMERVAVDVLSSGLSRENVELEGATVRDPHLRRHWLASYHPIRGNGSASSRLICVVNDVTSQKQASILRSAEHGVAQALTHAATFDEAIDAVLIALARPLGADFAEYWHWPDAAGNPERAASCSVDPDGAPRSKPLQAIPLEVGEGLVRRACQEKGPAWLDSSERAPSGGVATGALGLATSCAFPVRASDEIVGVIAFYARSPIEPSSALFESLAQIGRDLGQLWRRMQAEQAVRASEELFRSTIERAPIPIFLHAFDGAMLGVNRAFTAATGYSAVDLPEKRDWMRLLLRIPEDEIGEHIADLHRRLRSIDEFPKPQDVDIVTRIGHKRRWRLYRCPPMRLANGREFATTMAVDLTDRKIAEEALAEAKETAEEVSRLKSAFLANVSHEIRTPMSAILGYADVLREDVEDPEQRRILTTIKRNGLYLVDLIDDILDLSRVEADQLEIVPERVALQRLVLDVASLMRARAMEKGIELHVDFEGRVPETIETDPTRLRQILINLLGNAVKFTDEGQVRIRTLLREEGDAPCIQIEVIDTGIGIEDELRERLFDPFSRGSSTRSHARGGAGLGLAISHRLAGLMSGTLSVSSDASGSCFRLTLPAGDLDGIPRREMQDSVGDAHRAAPSRDRLDVSLRILVADDHPDVREAVDSMLSRIGARTTAAENGEVAIEAIAAAGDDDPFDVVLLDMQMPVLDGHETARRLRQRGYRGAIIALTAAATHADRERCLQSGCDDHLAKPVDRAALLEMLRRHARSDGPGGAAPESEAAPKARRVLLVEDDEDARMALTQLLRRRAGIDLRGTGTGAGALEQAASADWTPQVVLLDLTLPDMDGFEVLAALRKMPSLDDTLFVALTGRTEPEILDRATRSGIDEIVRKPVQDVGELARLILVAE